MLRRKYREINYFFSLSSLVDNLSEKLHSDKCKDCKSELDYMSVKNNQLIFQCFECKKEL